MSLSQRRRVYLLLRSQLEVAVKGSSVVVQVKVLTVAVFFCHELCGAMSSARANVGVPPPLSSQPPTHQRDPRQCKRVQEKEGECEKWAWKAVSAAAEMPA